MNHLNSIAYPQLQRFIIIFRCPQRLNDVMTVPALVYDDVTPPPGMCVHSLVLLDTQSYTTYMNTVVRRKP